MLVTLVTCTAYNPGAAARNHISWCHVQVRCRANVADTRQSRPDFGLGLQGKCLTPFQGVPCMLGRQRHARAPRRLTGLISHNVFIRSVLKGQFPHKFVNLSFMITNVKNKLTDLRGNCFLQNNFIETFCEMRSRSLIRPTPASERRGNNSNTC